ncbi:MAG TPA: CRTAC1 family protein, partial [Bryobacteraceae bacterium]
MKVTFGERNRAISVLILAAILMSWSPRQVTSVVFQDATSESGLDFVLNNHPTHRKYLPETMAGGIAAFDFDGDGRLDLFFANGAAIPGLEKTGSADWNRLYHNDGHGH